LALELFDLQLALDNQAQRRALHAAGRQARAYLAPQQRRQAEADEVVQRASRLLGVHQRQRDLAGMSDRFLHRGLVIS